MNADLSVAPEIAQLAAPHVRAPRPRATITPRTAGRAAGELASLVAAPHRWWDLVRFDPVGPVRIPVPGTAGAWLLVLPPGATADCDCGYATLLAGSAREVSGGLGGVVPPGASRATEVPGGLGGVVPPGASRAESAPLHAGRVRVYGRPAPHQVRGAGHGYSVSLHMAAATARSGE